MKLNISIGIKSKWEGSKGAEVNYCPTSLGAPPPPLLLQVVVRQPAAGLLFSVSQSPGQRGGGGGGGGGGRWEDAEKQQDTHTVQTDLALAVSQISEELVSLFHGCHHFLYVCNYRPVQNTTNTRFHWEIIPNAQNLYMVVFWGARVSDEANKTYLDTWKGTCFQDV